MKHRKLWLSIVLVLLVTIKAAVPAFAEGVKDEEAERKAKEYDSARYELMTHANDSWYDVAAKTGTSMVAGIKNLMWEINKVLGYLTMMIVYNMFSLDIIEMTKDSVSAIVSGTAGSLLKNFVFFGMALAGVGIVIKSYIKQDWQAFFKILTLILVSLTLLFSLTSKKFNYIDYVHEISLGLENAIMKVNPSLTKSDTAIDFENFDADNADSTKDIAVQIENKVFDAVIYKPYLLLQYGSTDEKKINQAAADKGIKYDKGENRITNYLNANPMTEKGSEKRQDIKEQELDDLKNSNIFAGNGFQSAAYIMGSIISTTIQGIVFFFLALMRILMQFAMICMLLIVPLILTLSLFPSFETLVSKYIKSLFMIIIFKGVLVFFILVATSFITLSYDMTDASNNIFYRIFVQILFSIAIIFMYMKRQFALNMLEGASLSLGDMGAHEGFGRKMMNSAPKMKKGNGANSIKKGKAVPFKKGERNNINRGKATGQAAAAKTRQGFQTAKEGIGNKFRQMKDHVSKVQNGEIPNHESPYHDRENGINSRENGINKDQEQVKDAQINKANQENSARNPNSKEARKVTAIHEGRKQAAATTTNHATGSGGSGSSKPANQKQRKITSQQARRQPEQVSHARSSSTRPVQHKPIDNMSNHSGSVSSGEPRDTRPANQWEAQQQFEQRQSKPVQHNPNVAREPEQPSRRETGRNPYARSTDSYMGVREDINRNSQPKPRKDKTRSLRDRDRRR